MAIEITIPALCHGSPEVKIVVWHKKVGESVNVGDLLVEVMTEKVNIEIDAPVNGVITAILVPEDGFAAVGAVIARMVERAQPREIQ